MGDGPSKGASEPVTEARVSQLEEEVRWLRLAVEKEKSEKEWLMRRYDEDARIRNDEIGRLRAQLDAPASSSTQVALRPKPSAIYSPIPSDGDSESDKSAAHQPGVASSGLRARRNLTLGGVSTDRPSSSDPAAAAAASEVARAPKLDNGSTGARQHSSALHLSGSMHDDIVRPTSCSSADAALLGGPARTLTLRPALGDGMLEPMTDCRHNVRTWAATGHLVDSHSLWRRRLNEVAQKATQIEAGEVPFVQTPKVYKLDRAVPDSPKRPPPQSSRRVRRDTWCAPTILEDEEQKDAGELPDFAEHTQAEEPDVAGAELGAELAERQKKFAERQKKRASKDHLRFISNPT